MENKFGISKNVFVLGLVSFFNDVASEMIYPIVPIFLTSVLGAPVAIVGLIEGIAESTASVLKVVSGWLSDKLQKRKPFVVAGYSFSAISKILLSLAFSWPFVLFARFIDRFGKGVRTSARDALIAESSDTSTRGKSFGFHRALDTLGAVVGPLIALLAIHFLDNNFRLIFFLAFIPACIGILLLLFFVKERKKEANLSPALNLSWRNLDPSFKIFLLISFVFALGNSSDAFLILRAQNLGLSVTLVVLAYVLFNFTYTIFSMPAGIISDKIGPKKVLFSGFLLFSFIYLFFGLTKVSLFLWLLFPFYGMYMALTEGVGKAYISNLVPQEKTGTAFGIYQTTIGLCTFFASLIAGLLWTYIGVSAPFIFGSIMAAISAFLFVVLEKKIKIAKI
ncbi:MAG: major facilitator transporter [Candidatus Peregrinibacteria bacterium GW2011_GWE2_39_6]|nr:MAG: major facilitator transporter [Candidatus Peregrinibacteria bacterium GW2011_GWF2_39_17]KKR26371.1 MAG: major facilitator transporter [Candidatus Peregrinibacteria bacterium GW2011_GWE2_39_6]HCW32518.1 MFS transporter [Candidatus Peregrinibacteria bacterium]